VRLTLDLTPALRGSAGIARYTRELARALSADAPADEVWQGFAAGVPAGVSAQPTLTSQVAWPVRVWRAYATLSHLAGLDASPLIGATDVFIASDHCLPRLPRQHTILIVYDCTYLSVPTTHSALNRLYLRLSMPHFLRAADQIVAISQATRRDLVRYYPFVTAKPVRVAPPGLTPGMGRPPPTRLADVKRRYQLPDRFMLYVGTLEPRKNLGIVLSALTAPALRDVPLIVAGRRGWLVTNTLRQVERLGLQSRVRELGLVPDEDLAGLYSLATTFVFPSRYEGFGLPVLEALACGAPVVCSDASSLPEVARPAARLVDPTDVDAWRAALVELWHDPRARTALADRGPAHAARFTWAATAAEFRTLWRSDGPHPRRQGE
jgi:glycosyltransferase involved in cell wall biosynthesis